MQFLDLACIAAATAFAAGTAQAAPVARAPAVVSAQSQASLSVTFTGVEEKQGMILLALYDEAGWSAGRPLRTAMADAATGEAKVGIADLPVGRYGVKAFHDVNGNGKMDSNPFGMPTEPFAFSNNAHGKMGPAEWTDAAFAVEPGANTQTITIR